MPRKKRTSIGKVTSGAKRLRLLRKNETPEQTQQRQAADRARAYISRANETPEQTEARRAYARIRASTSRANFKGDLEKIETDLAQIDRALEKLTNKKQKLISRRNVLIQKLEESASEKLANQNTEITDHPPSHNVFHSEHFEQQMSEVLESFFKLTKFRPYQLSTINAVMSEQDCILLMPTGGGKSLCYQLPAMVFDGITLVVSPLVSLMEDQIMAMQALDIPATLLNASSTREHVNHVHKQMTEKNPSIKLLYVTPEKLAKSKRFMAKLEKMYQIGKFPLLAIDEVHCCSQWGHDFRTDYKFLGIMKRQFPKVPILGLTATATSAVIADVQKILNIPGSLVLKASFNRPNLKYEVISKSSCQKDNIQSLENLLKNRFNGLSGIIYCFSIKECEDISSELRKVGCKAKAYHAQLDAKTRSSIHKSWTCNSIQVIVATVAFGMGIDKPDVRFVIHHSIPKSMENFYQESGRAGRDDQPASCILFYRFADIFRQSSMVFTEQKGLEHLHAMIAYCLDLSRCRRAIIADHFGERWESADCNGMCDHCDKYNPYEEVQKNVFNEYRTICNILTHAFCIDERLTCQKLLDAWQGKGPLKFRPEGLKATLMSRENCERVVAFLLLESYLSEDFHFTPYSTISYINIGTRHVNNEELLIPMPQLKKKNSSDSNDNTDSSSKEPLLKKIKSSSSSSYLGSTDTVSSVVIQGSSKTYTNTKSAKLCAVNKMKSHFHTDSFGESNEPPSKEKSEEVKSKNVTKKIVVPEEIELSSDELEFDSYDIQRTHENSVSLQKQKDSSDDDVISFKQKNLNRTTTLVSVSDSD